MMPVFEFRYCQERASKQTFLLQHLPLPERLRMSWWLLGPSGHAIALARDLLALVYMLGLSAAMGSLLRDAALAARDAADV